MSKKKCAHSPVPSEKFRAFRKLLSDELSCWWRQTFRPTWENLVFTSLCFLSPILNTMINTFHTSFNPPPVPPRPGLRGAMLTKNTPLLKFLSVMLLLLMLLTFGGFLYLFHKLSMLQERSSMLKMLQQCMEESPKPEEVLHCKTLVDNYMAKVSQIGGKMAYLAGTGSSTIPQAVMVLSEQTSESKRNEMDTLIWDQKRSKLEMISLGMSGALTIQFPGYYFVHSQVTFSKWHMKAPLMQVIWTRKTKPEEKTKNKNEESLLMAYCNLPRLDSSLPDLCTASQTGVFMLEKHQQLFVNVTDRSLVNLSTSTFRLFKLRD